MSAADIWVTIKECIGLPGLPGTAPGIRNKLINFIAGQEELSRKRAGTKAIEFNMSVLPTDARAALLKRRNQVETSTRLVTCAPPAIRSQVDPARVRLWKCWESAGTEQRATAETRVHAVILMTELIASGMTVRSAADTTARTLAISANTLRRWYGKTLKHPRSDWAPALLDTRLICRPAPSARALFDEVAWEFLRSDYLRKEQPALTKCYERLVLAARDHEWAVPSFDTVRRRVEQDIPLEVRVLLREGEHALNQLYPSQRRSVADLHALEWINGDGYQHNVRVIWHNGEELRPKTWFWQDVYSRKIIGYRVDVSENTDSIRYSLLDVIRKFGKPQKATIDNTRSAANKTMTGGVSNRYRFKVRPDDVQGILPMLGIEVHWTSIVAGKGWGQAKPIERAFGVGAMEEYVDKHPLCAGAYTGPNPMNKPDYKIRAIPVEAFLSAVEQGVAMFNAAAERRTEICAGKLSFNDAFEQSYSQQVIQWLPEQQLRMLMLSTEAVTVQRDGSFVLKSGGKIQQRENRYAAPELRSVRTKIVARFDPQDLHSRVWCYTLDGEFICEAECLAPVAFGDTRAAREHKRHRTQLVKATKKAAVAQKQMDALEIAELMGRAAEPHLPVPPVVQMFSAGNTMRKVRVAAEPELSEDDLAFERHVDELYRLQK